MTNVDISDNILIFNYVLCCISELQVWSKHVCQTAAYCTARIDMNRNDEVRLPKLLPKTLLIRNSIELVWCTTWGAITVFLSIVCFQCATYYLMNGTVSSCWKALTDAKGQASLMFACDTFYSILSTFLLANLCLWLCLKFPPQHLQTSSDTNSWLHAWLNIYV